MKHKKQQDNGGLDSILDILTKLISIIIDLLVKFLIYIAKLICAKFKESYLKVFSNQPLVASKFKRKETTVEILGKSVNKQRLFKMSELDTTTHTGIFGSTGTGKSVLISRLIVNSLKRNIPVIYFDPKPTQSTLSDLINYCGRFNKKCYVIGDLSKSDIGYNPLSEGDISNQVNNLMNALVWSEPFYKNEATKTLFNTFKHLNLSNKSPTIRNIVEALELVKDKKAISALDSQLYAIQQTSSANYLNQELNSISLAQIIQEGSCLYIGISAMTKSDTGSAINKLIFGDLLRITNEKLVKQETLPVSIFFDELSSTVHEGFIDLQNKCRAAKVELYYATQCPSDLEKVSENFMNQVMENTNNLFVFNQIIPKHTDLFSKLCGTTTVTKKTYATDDEERSGQGTEREVEALIAHPNIFRSLEVGQCVFIQRKPSKRVDLLNISTINKWLEKSSKEARPLEVIKTQSSVF